MIVYIWLWFCCFRSSIFMESSLAKSYMVFFCMSRVYPSRLGKTDCSSRLVYLVERD